MLANPNPTPAPLTETAQIVDRNEMRPGLPTEEVVRRLTHSGRDGDCQRRLDAFYLVEVDERRLYQAMGHSSTRHFAKCRLEIDRRRCGDLLRIGRKLLELRELDRLFCEGRIGWTRMDLVTQRAVPEHEAAWIERALVLDADALEKLVRRSKPGGPPAAAGNEKGLPEIRFPFKASLSPLVHAKVEQAQRRLAAELGREVTVAELLDTLAGQFLSTTPEGEVPGRKRLDASLYRVELCDRRDGEGALCVHTNEGSFPIDEGGPGAAGALSEAVRCDAGVRSHHDHDDRARDVQTSDEMRGRVLRRDGYRCRSCRGREDLHVHHIKFRSHGGRTKPFNLITLCLRCHGLLHAGLLKIEGTSAEAARFLDAKGNPIEGVQAIAALGVELRKLVPPPAPVPPEAAAAERNEVADAERVTLSRVPAEIDATWWRRHAHLIKDGGDSRDLRFQSGSPVELPEVETQATAPASEAFADLIGQEPRIARLKVTAEGVRARGKRFPHVLLEGPAGTGKTSLARGIATLGQQPIVELSGPLLRERATLVRLLADLPEGSVLFLDEAHAMPLALHETLLQAMSEQRLNLTLSDASRTKQVCLRLPAFTLIAATTHKNMLPKALRDRFGLRESTQRSTDEQLAKVVTRAATAGGTEATSEGALTLARMARGTPREALRLVEEARNDMVVAGSRCLDEALAKRTLERLEYDAEGLLPDERHYLEILRGSPDAVSLARLAALLGRTPQTIVEEIEPWLFQRRLARTTWGGRIALPFSVPDEAPPRGAPDSRREPRAALSTA